MDKHQAFEMYKLFRGERYESLKLHHENFQKYLAFVVTVLGVTIAGAFSAQGVGYLEAVLVIGPILNVLVCLLAVKTGDRFYRGFLERVTIIAKLESLLEIRGNVEWCTVDESKSVFGEDRYIFPERWIKGTSHKTASEFVQQNLRLGVNKQARRTFHALIVVNLVLVAVIILFAFL